MCAFPASFLTELRDRVTLSDLVRPAVGAWDMKKSNTARRDFWSPCPFHQEKSSSFHVDDNKGFYHCFGCGVHGSGLDFLMKHQKMAFMDAVKHLAEIAGLQMPVMSPYQAEKQKNEKSLYDVLQTASGFYTQYLHSKNDNHQQLDQFQINFHRKYF